MCMRIIISLLLILFSLPIFAAEKGLVLSIDSPIGPATQDYIERGINKATKEGYQFILLELNTPGGLEASMRNINAAMLASPVPIITYVTPSGARAASAGVFIMYASHFSAMAPGTNIGAASPVSLTNAASDYGKISTEEKKAINDAAAYMRSLAELRHRNAEWGEKAVRQAASVSAKEAKTLNIIDEFADNRQQLLQKINGRSVLLEGKTKILNTAHIQLENMQAGWRHQFLSFLTNPNIIYILILIAMYGLFFELSTPGLILPGVAGVIALLLVLYALQLMPINYAGLLLVLLGTGFMALEFFIASFGVIGIGGLIAFTIGSIMLFDIHDNHYRIAWTVIVIMSLMTFVFFFLVMRLAIQSQKKSITTGQEGLIGSEGIVIAIKDNKMLVRVLGELWEAQSTVHLNEEDKIRVTAIKDLILFVEPIKLNQRNKSGV